MYDDLYTGGINCCGLSYRDIKECQGVFDSKTPELKQADIQAFTWTISSLQMYDDLYTGEINCCGTVRQRHKGMPRGL
jgi:hypothetical protein